MMSFPRGSDTGREVDVSALELAGANLRGVSLLGLALRGLAGLESLRRIIYAKGRCVGGGSGRLLLDHICKIQSK